MKRLKNAPDRSDRTIGWIQYIGMVLAFIGLWQLLAGGVAFLQHRF